jgi:hypothetical protein
MKLSTLAPVVLGCIACSAQAQNLMSNGSFETAGPGFVEFADWQNFGNVFTADSGEIAAQDGSVCAKMFGGFIGVQSDQVLLQTVENINEGTLYTLSTYAQHLSTDMLEEGNIILLQMNFQNESGATLETVEVDALTENSVTDEWINVSVEGIAPPGTTQIFVALLHIQLEGFGDGAPGASFWDNVQLVEGGEVCTNPADFTGDGVLNFFDISAFLAEYSKGCP